MERSKTVARSEEACVDLDVVTVVTAAVAVANVAATSTIVVGISASEEVALLTCLYIQRIKAFCSSSPIHRSLSIMR